MVESHEPAPDHTDEEPTELRPARWTGSAPVPVPMPVEKRRWRGVLREPTAELPTVDEPWPSPPPPRPANAPVTAPYPPPTPPGWHPPPRPPSGGRPYPPPPYRRRRRRWPWVLGTLGLLVAVCCGCCFSIFKPFIDQYPATATLPTQAVSLVQLTDATSVAAATKREGSVRSRHWLADNVFAAVYAEPRTGQRPVTIFGATMLVFDPERDLKNEFAALAAELSPTDIRAVEPGPAGGHQRCAEGRRAGNSVTICGWADHGSIALAIFSGRTLDDSAQLLRDLRAEIISRA